MRGGTVVGQASFTMTEGVNTSCHFNKTRLLLPMEMVEEEEEEVEDRK